MKFLALLIVCIGVVTGLYISNRGAAAAKALRPIGSVEAQVEQMSASLRSSAENAKARLTAALGVATFHEQIEVALASLKGDPRNLARQLEVIDLHRTHIAGILAALHGVNDADLPALRDRVVAGYRSLAETTASEADRHASRAKDARGDFGSRYHDIASTMARLSKAYSGRADSYARAKLEEQLHETREAIDFLQSLQGSLGVLRDGIVGLEADEASLKELLGLAATMDQIQGSLNTFSVVVFNGVLEADPPSSATIGAVPMAAPTPSKSS